MAMPLLHAQLSWANRHYAASDVPVASASFLTTLVDFHKPGDVEVFLDEGSFKYLSHNMEQKGFLDGKEMAAAFRLLRSNSLIWHYAVHGYLYGESPPPFDVLFWNMDTTRMPAKMHTWYLRNFYLDNKLIKKDALEIAGQPIDLSRIVQPFYAVAAADDHIAPWEQTFRLNNLVSGPKCYVLSSSGHIFGIVNPVVHPPKREYWVGDTERHDNAEDWRARNITWATGGKTGCTGSSRKSCPTGPTRSVRMLRAPTFWKVRKSALAGRRGRLQLSLGPIT